MEPLISIRLPGKRQYRPAQTIAWQYQIDAVAPHDIQAVEASILWYTEGKGESDMLVHFFERRVPGTTEVADLRAMRTITLALPRSPLTYDGVILKIRWCARVKLFMRSGKSFLEEQAFRLGNVPPGRVYPEPGQALTDLAAAVTLRE